MINVKVQRLPADKQGPDISDSLIASVPVAVERGRIEVDKSFSNRETVTMAGPLNETIEHGEIVEIADTQQEAWCGIVTAAEITIERGDSFSADISLTVEREHVE